MGGFSTPQSIGVAVLLVTLAGSGFVAESASPLAGVSESPVLAPSDLGRGPAPTGATTVRHEDAKLIGSDVTSFHEFGASVYVSGDTILAGARFSDSGAGAAYAFVREGDDWREQAKLLADDPSAIRFNNFGMAVAIGGDSAIVSGRGGEVGDGRVYTFDRVGENWIKRTTLARDQVADTGFFGITNWAPEASPLAMTGDTVVVGAELDEIRDTFDAAGSASVFRRQGDTWILERKLIASLYQEDLFFGLSVAVDGDTVVVGAPFHDITTGFGLGDEGMAYVYVRDGGRWTEQRRLFAPDTGPGDRFGWSVGVSAGTIVVGSPRAGLPGGAFVAGAAYVYVKEGADWVFQEKLVASDFDSFDKLGNAVAISGDRIVAGAPFDEHAGLSSGSAYLFQRANGTWTEEAKLVPSDSTRREEFGMAVAIDGQVIAVGSQGHPGGGDAGAVYVFGPKESAEFTVTMASFIPSNYLEGPKTSFCLTKDPFFRKRPRQLVFAGDDRGFLLNAESFRTRQSVTVVPDESVDEDGVKDGTIPESLTKETRAYASDALADNGRLDPGDDDGVLRDCHLLHDRDIAGTEEMFVDVVRTGEQEVEIRLHCGAANPLIRFSPAIDWDFILTINTNNKNAF